MVEKAHALCSSTTLRLCASCFLCSVVLVRPATLYALDADSATNAALCRACEYLWSQQAEDGGWHSQQYALLRSGQALTPFVLHALLEVPESVCPRPENGVQRALDFIRRHVDENGVIGRADPDIVEYPVYSTAYALRCLVAVRDDPELAEESDGTLITRMYSFLSAAQFDESQGFATNHPAYGGWGFDKARAAGEPGHMDLAHTRRALQALRTLIGDRAAPQFTRGELFLRVVQRNPGALARPNAVGRILHYGSKIPYDGGFYFSPVVEQVNKGRFASTHNGESAPHFRSYATATCDGVLALLACGVGRNDDRLIRATEWLRNHGDFESPEGIPTDHPEPWGWALRFYHYAVRAEAYDALDWPGDWRDQLATAVTKRQAVDGSFRNGDSPLMKEDDPLLATSLAIVALSHCSR